MALENAQKFLERVMADEALRERVAEKEPAEVAAVAKELGFEVTAEELIEAANMMRKPDEENLKELSLAEMDQAAGGKWFLAEDAPDGHEFDCAIFYHSYSYHLETGYWCKENWYCNQNNKVNFGSGYSGGR